MAPRTDQEKSIPALAAALKGRPLTGLPGLAIFVGYTRPLAAARFFSMGNF